FNSPFWPFVLASTSVGQEGLDFHTYSHAVVHWNLPPTPWILNNERDESTGTKAMLFGRTLPMNTQSMRLEKQSRTRGIGCSARPKRRVPRAIRSSTHIG